MMVHSAACPLRSARSAKVRAAPSRSRTALFSDLGALIGLLACWVFPTDGRTLPVSHHFRHSEVVAVKSEEELIYCRLLHPLREAQRASRRKIAARVLDH